MSKCSHSCFDRHQPVQYLWWALFRLSAHCMIFYARLGSWISHVQQLPLATNKSAFLLQCSEACLRFFWISPYKNCISPSISLRAFQIKNQRHLKTTDRHCRRKGRWFNHGESTYLCKDGLQPNTLLSDVQKAFLSAMVPFLMFMPMWHSVWVWTFQRLPMVLA